MESCVAGLGLFQRKDTLPESYILYSVSFKLSVMFAVELLVMFAIAHVSELTILPFVLSETYIENHKT